MTSVLDIDFTNTNVTVSGLTDLEKYAVSSEVARLNSGIHVLGSAPADLEFSMIEGWHKTGLLLDDEYALRVRQYSEFLEGNLSEVELREGGFFNSAVVGTGGQLADDDIDRELFKTMAGGV